MREEVRKREKRMTSPVVNAGESEGARENNRERGKERKEERVSERENLKAFPRLLSSLSHSRSLSLSSSAKEENASLISIAYSAV